jgi:NitT/TauT family transport system substrate-binding protein
MDYPRTAGWSRRAFLHRLTLVGTTGLLGLRPRPLAAEPPPETTRLRLHKTPGICIAPQYVAEELLHLEGFTEVHYVAADPAKITSGIYQQLATGALDISMAFVPPFIIQVDVGSPIVLLGGVHVGCYEVFGTDRVRAIRDLKGKTVAVPELGGSHHLFVASMAQYVGLDPHKDIHWAVHPPAEAIQLLAEGTIDALVGFPPVPQELRARQIGQSVVSSAVDRPWSQYFCCIVTGNREFVRTHPVATKRALRAILKATDVCALEPARAAQLIVDKGFTPRYDYALQTMQETPYNRWREYDPEDTVRFYALRLHEIGMVKSTPQKIIAQGTDWRFFNELKRELKG